jgi:hypothetical protein
MTLQEKEALFREYYSVGAYDLQRTYLLGLMDGEDNDYRLATLLFYILNSILINILIQVSH